jgi:hypothetical protein
MAAFMNRLGKALSMQLLFAESGTGAITVPSTPPAEIRCSTADTAATVYPRSAIVNATLTGLADANAIAWRGAIVYSTDGGATWQQSATTQGGMRASSPGGQTTNVAMTTPFDLTPGLSYRFAVSVLRDNVIGGTPGNIVSGRCQLTARIVNRNGTSSPYDVQTAR